MNALVPYSDESEDEATSLSKRLVRAEGHLTCPSQVSSAKYANRRNLSTDARIVKFELVVLLA